MKNRIMVMAVSLLVCQMLFCSCSSDNAELPDMTSTGQQPEIQKQEEPSEVQQIQSKEKSSVKETQKPKEDGSKKSEASDSQWKYWFDEEHGVKGSGTQLDDGMEILVQSTGNAPYQAQVNYERVSLEKGKTYHIEFDYESDADLYWIYQ